MSTIIPPCPQCGAIGKSGKYSCCGRGGSWFGNCGGVGHIKLGHTWYEGIQACKATHEQLRAIHRQSNADHPLHLSNGVANSTSVAPANAFALTSTKSPVQAPGRPLLLLMALSIMICTS